jgi:hypothetical protein
MGTETTYRTRKALLGGGTDAGTPDTDGSIESDKVTNPFLVEFRQSWKRCVQARSNAASTTRTSSMPRRISPTQSLR